MASQSRPIDSRIASPCSSNSGARVVLDEVAVGDRVLVGRDLERVLHRRPLSAESLEALSPLVECRFGEHLAEDGGRLGALAMIVWASAKRSSSLSSGRPM
jgi:hypothetical protein